MSFALSRGVLLILLPCLALAPCIIPSPSVPSPPHLNLRSCYDLFHGHPPSQFFSLADHLSPPSVNLPEASSHHTFLSFKNVSGTPSLVCVSSLSSCLLVLRLCRGRISQPISTEVQFPGQWGDPVDKPPQTHGISVGRKEARAAGDAAPPGAQGNSEEGQQITASPEEGWNLSW